VRPRRAGDLDDLVGLASRVRAADGYPAFLPDDDLPRFLTRPEPLRAWVYEHGGRIVGHVALNTETSPPVMRLAGACGVNGTAAFVARLLVDPSARRLGYGTHLLDHARRAAIDLGLIPLLNVVATSAAAISLSGPLARPWIVSDIS
jgi:GNAT superfamily N-acetyltransferase